MDVSDDLLSAAASGESRLASVQPAEAALAPSGLHPRTKHINFLGLKVKMYDKHI